jgi:excisionase family DNA binding protein
MSRRSSTAHCRRSAEKHMEPYLASIADAQRALGIGRTTAYRLMDAGKLEKVKIGRRTLIKIASIKALAGEGQHPCQSNPE